MEKGKNSIFFHLIRHSFVMTPVSLRLGHTRGKTILNCFLRPSCRFATSRGRLGRCDTFNNSFKQSKNPCFFTNQPPKEWHKLASFVQREVARLAVTEGLFKAQGHLIRLAGSAPSPTGEGLGDVLLSTTVLNKAKIPTFHQSTAERAA